jgi:hypothetical protein
MILVTCPNRDRTSAEAPGKAGDRGPIRPASQPVRASAASAACQCHRCAERASHRSKAGDDVDAYIADLAERAPLLTGEQRDKLALLLHDHRLSRVTAIRTAAA